MAGPGICVLYLADTCTSEVHPVFNPVAPYGYLLSDMYLFMADITNPDFLVKSCRTWIGLDITRFCEQQRQPSSGSAWPACPKKSVCVYVCVVHIYILYYPLIYYISPVI